MTTPPSDTLKDIRVLLVEDFAEHRLLSKTILEKFGAIVDSVATVDEALLEIDNFVPDLVVSDLGLPKRNGLELIESLHRNHPDIGIIALTASFDQKTKERSLKAGADAFITKPCPASLLIAEIKKVALRTCLNARAHLI